MINIFKYGTEYQYLKQFVFFFFMYFNYLEFQDKKLDFRIDYWGLVLGKLIGILTLGNLVFPVDLFKEHNTNKINTNNFKKKKA